MGSTKTFKPYKRSVSPTIKKQIDCMLHQLEHTGRAITHQGQIVKPFAGRCNTNLPKDGRIRFVWDNKHRESIVVLKPGYELKRYKNKRISINRDPNFK